MIAPTASAARRVTDRLGEWLRSRIAGASMLAIRDVVEPKQGLSSETVLFTAAWHGPDGGQSRELVARIQRPTICPMLADVFHQYRVMEAAAAHTDAPLPSIPFKEHESTILGAPFFLMDRVAGRVPTDFPSYHGAGWVKELAASDRTQLWWNAIHAMERLHRADWTRFPFIAKGHAASPDAAFYLRDFIVPWFSWAAQGRNFPRIVQAIDYLIVAAPPVRRAGLVWNDARMGNTMFDDDLRVAALFDFEVASLGPAEIDLAWWLYCEDLFSIQFGLPRLAGIPDGDEALRGFQRIYGRPMADFDYYLAIAALKHAVLAIRDYSNGKTVDVPEALPDFALRRLDRHIGRHRTSTGR